MPAGAAAETLTERIFFLSKISVMEGVIVFLRMEAAQGEPRKGTSSTAKGRSPFPVRVEGKKPFSRRS